MFDETILYTVIGGGLAYALAPFALHAKKVLDDASSLACRSINRKLALVFSNTIHSDSPMYDDVKCFIGQNVEPGIFNWTTLKNGEYGKVYLEENVLDIPKFGYFRMPTGIGENGATVFYRIVQIVNKQLLPRQPAEDTIVLYLIRQQNAADQFLQLMKHVSGLHEKVKRDEPHNPECWHWDASQSKWESFGEFYRPENSVFLARETQNQLDTVVSNFLSKAKAMRERGLSNRDGLIMHGPPGCGKSTSVAAIACRYGVDIFVISMSQDRLDDISLAKAAKKLPPSLIRLVVFDEIDLIFKSSDASEATHRAANRVTTAGLLGLMDGPSAPENVLFAATSNHIENLPPALLRKGRFGNILQVGPCTLESACQITRNLCSRGADDAAITNHAPTESALERMKELWPPKVDLIPVNLQHLLRDHCWDASAAIDSLEWANAHEKSQ